jgi:hypothetical protein
MAARYWSEQLAEALRAELEGNEEEAGKGEEAGTAVGVVGLDLEWKPTFAAGAPEKKAAVLQIAGPGLCLVVQMMKLGGQLPKALRDILRDPRLLKVCICMCQCNGLRLDGWRGRD